MGVEDEEQIDAFVPAEQKKELNVEDAIQPNIIPDAAETEAPNITTECLEENDDLFHLYGLKPFIMKCIDEKPVHVTDYTYDDLNCECGGKCKECKVMKQIFESIFKKNGKGKKK